MRHLGFCLIVFACAAGFGCRGNRATNSNQQATKNGVGTAEVHGDRASQATRVSGPPSGLTERQREAVAADDPTKDGWESEATHDQIKSQLKALAKALVKPDDANVKAVFADRFACGELGVEGNVTFDDGLLRVSRGEPNADAAFPDLSGFKSAARVLWGDVTPADDDAVRFKVFNIQSSEGLVVTRQFVTLRGILNDQPWEHHATWRIVWEAATPATGPRIRRIAAEKTEESQTLAGGQLFDDCTASVLGKNESYGRQIVHGVNHWLGRVDAALKPDLFGYQGVAIGDVNGDGLDDVYACQPGGLPNKLFVQQPDGTAIDLSAEAGVDWNDLTSSALFVDLDNDGDQDLVAVTDPAVVIAENDGEGNFSVRDQRETTADYISVTASDIDGDGDLDLYLCAYNPAPGDGHSFATPRPLHDANNGGRNALLRCDGDWQFTDATTELGLDVNNSRFSFAASWQDYDNDGDSDLYVANDWGRNNLYRNDAGTFVDVTTEANAEDGNFGMSVAWGDYDRDGHTDLYIGNMFSSAGNRIMTQGRFKPGISDELRARMLKLARGNTLLRNDGGGQFHDVSVDAGVTVGLWSWGSVFVDLNLDGWDDLVVANGYVTNDGAPGDL